MPRRGLRNLLQSSTCTHSPDPYQVNINSPQCFPCTHSLSINRCSFSWIGAPLAWLLHALVSPVGFILLSYQWQVYALTPTELLEWDALLGRWERERREEGKRAFPPLAGFLKDCKLILVLFRTRTVLGRTGTIDRILFGF